MEFAAFPGKSAFVVTALGEPAHPPLAAIMQCTQNVLSQLATSDFEERWVDIGFWITPAGRASEAEVIRGLNSSI